jgi:hypothetical protein
VDRVGKSWRGVFRYSWNHYLTKVGIRMHAVRGFGSGVPSPLGIAPMSRLPSHGLHEAVPLVLANRARGQTREYRRLTTAKPAWRADV